MVYNALATMWYGGYDPKPQFYILLGKLNTMQRQRHHTPEPLGNIPHIPKTGLISIANVWLLPDKDCCYI